MIDRTLATDERISLITAIFADHDQTQMVANLAGDDAQAFVDVIDEASPHTISCSMEELIDFGSNLYTPSIRRWIVLNHRSAGCVYPTYTGFAAAMPYFRNRWQFRFVMTHWGTRFAVADLLIYGRVSI